MVCVLTLFLRNYSDVLLTLFYSKSTLAFTSALPLNNLLPPQVVHYALGAPLPATLAYLEVQAKTPLLLMPGLVLFHLLMIIALWLQP